MIERYRTQVNVSQPDDHLASAEMSENLRVRRPSHVNSAPSREASMAARATGADPLPGEVRAFQSVDGLPELAVTALRRAGLESLLPSQKNVLRFLSIGEGLRTNYNKVIVGPAAAGKSTLLCLAGFAAVMRSSNGNFEALATGGSPHGTNSFSVTSSSESPANTRPSSAPAKPLVLIVMPSSEVAREAGAFLDLLLTFHGSSCATFAGDVLAASDLAALSKWPAAVICTFDRLLNLVEHGHLDLSGLLYLAIDDFDTCLQDESFISFLQILQERLPECQVVVTSSSMVRGLVAPIMALLQPTSPIPAVVTMRKWRESSTSTTQEITDMELVDEFRKFRQAQ